MSGALLHFRDWHREVHWIVFHDQQRVKNTIAAIKTYQWYKTAGLVFDPKNPPPADRLELAGVFRRRTQQVVKFDGTKDLLEQGELAEKVAWIQKECGKRGIPVTLSDSQ